MELRWLIDPPADGVTNMARDEAILTSVGRGDAPPTLRFYRWNPPTISLGYFQAYADYEALPPPAGDLSIVRRQTGGGAILHDLELTYSLTAPLDHPLAGKGHPSRLYYLVHDTLADLLARAGIVVRRGPKDLGTCSHNGPFFCFERYCCFDLMAEDGKIMGSAQRRTRDAVLQHGSLVFDRRFDQQKCSRAIACAGFDVDSHLHEWGTAILGCAMGKPSPLTDEEEELAECLRSKYADPAWTKKR